MRQDIFVGLIYRGEQADRTDISHTFNNCDKVWGSGIKINLDCKADWSFILNGVEEYSGKSVSHVGEESG